MMMTNAEQLLRLFLSLGFGMWLSVYHRLLRLHPPREPHRAVKLFCIDWFFAVSSAVMFFFFSLPVNAGTIRPSMLAAVAVGFAVGNRTVGRWIALLAIALSRVFSAVGRTVSRLLGAVAARLLYIFKKITIFLKKGLRSLYTLVYNRKRQLL